MFTGAPKVPRRKKSNRTKRNKINHEIQFLEEQISNNNLAAMEGPKKKTWSLHDLNVVKPLNERQHDMYTQFFSGDHVCAYGSAGTGKTFLATYLAMNEVLNTDTLLQRMIIVRSAVPVRDLGHLPGTLDEKVALYEEPYKNIFAELFKHSKTYDNMKNAGLVEFMTTSYIRGLTWDNVIVVIDEVQNLTWEEINSVMTRIGSNSRVIVVGDIKQTDLNSRSTGQCGMSKFIKVMDNMNEFSSVEFTRDDIVRSSFVKSWIISTESIAA